MIRKIICPTDFSEAANNATGYAAKLAQIYQAELLLIHVATPIAGIRILKTDETSVQLITRCAEISKQFRISADYEIETGTGSLADHIARAKQEKALVVMGTNGSDTLYERFFGTLTYNVIRKTNCPVLVVPEGVDYGTIRKVVFAWNYKKGEKFSFTELHELTKSFDPQYVFLHVSTHKPPIAQEIFTAFRHEAEEYLDKRVKAQFEQVYARSVPRGIDDYMKKSGADLLTITFLNRKMLRSFFHGQITEKFIDHVTYPILVLHI